MLSSIINSLNSSLIKRSSRKVSTKSIIQYIPVQKKINPFKKTELTKQITTFFQQSPIETNKDLTFHINNDTLTDITVQKNFKKNIYEHCLYFQVTDQGISAYKDIVKNISKTQKKIKYEFKPAHGIIRIYCDVQLDEVNGKKYLPISSNTPLFLK
jgi:hypothetical protein